MEMLLLLLFQKGMQLTSILLLTVFEDCSNYPVILLTLPEEVLFALWLYCIINSFINNANFSLRQGFCCY